MSLNGLDAASVKEAHEAAVAEAGGWYVTKFLASPSSHAIRSLCHGKGELFFQNLTNTLRQDTDSLILVKIGLS